jgi:hypothetical protein
MQLNRAFRISGCLFLLGLLVLPGSAELSPVVDVSRPDARIVVPTGLSAEDVQRAIRASMLDHHWVLGDAPAGWLYAKYVRSFASIELRISYDAQQVEVFVCEWAKGGRPLAEQKRWLNNVDNEIAGSLRRALFFKK